MSYFERMSSDSQRPAPNLISQAAARISANPFVVSEDDIKLTDLDLVIRLSKDELSLRAHPRRRTRIKRLIEGAPGAHYVKSERSYLLPTISLPPLLKLLRDKEYSFAVSSAAGEKLSASAKLRAKIVDKKHLPSSAELVESLLTPAVTLSSPGQTPLFSLVGFTTDQLRIALSHLPDHKKRILVSKSFDTLILRRILQNIQATDLRVWLCREAFQAIEAFTARAGVALDESTIAISPPPIAWIVGKENRPGLLVEESLLKKLALPKNDLKGKVKATSYPHAPGWTLLSCIESALIWFKELVLLHAKELQPEIPETGTFKKKLIQLAKSQEQRKRNLAYHSLADVSIESSRTALLSALFPHQRVAVKFLSENPAAFLGDDMGLGKTLSVLTTFALLKDQGQSDLLLVACPNSLTRNWIREGKQWTPWLNLALFPQTKSEREKFLKQTKILPKNAFDGLIINYETLRIDSVYPAIQALCAGRNTLLCLDESQRVKNSQSKTFEALKVVSDVCPRRILLSGTPTPKDIADIWGQMFILDRGERLGTSYFKWLAQVAELGNKWSEFAVKKFIPEEVEETISRVREVLLRRKKEQVINLPEKTFIIRDVELSGDQKKRYDEVCEELLIRITRSDGNFLVKEIHSILEEYLRAVQAASNPRLIDENWKGEPAKFLELDEIVHEIVTERDEKIVIWTNYRKNVTELTQRYSALGSAAFFGDTPPAERQNLVNRFQNTADKSLRILIAVPAAGGVGITLTAAQTAVYLDKSWNAEHWLQSIDRIHRIGQNGTVNIISLISGGVDELISYSLRRKEKFQARVLGDGEHAEMLPTREELVAAVQGSKK